MTREETITIDVTPKRLRQIADNIEQRMEKAVVGDSVPFESFYMPGLTVVLRADQGAWHASKQGGSWK